jgi:uncharacterized protein
MINVTIERFRTGGVIWEVLAEGHALYESGKENIVCASVSTATIVTANAIKYLRNKKFFELETSPGYFKIHPTRYDTIIDGLLKNLEFTLDELQKQYPEHIKVSKIEKEIKKEIKKNERYYY